VTARQSPGSVALYPAAEAWWTLGNVADVSSPALVIYPDRAAANIDRMIEMAGGPARLRPHVKTHKLPQIVRMHLDRGITRFKCATLAEAEMTAMAGAEDVLLAYQPVGPAVDRLARLIERYPHTRFAALVDDRDALEAIARAGTAESPVTVLLDVDIGMHRTGVAPDDCAFDLYAAVAATPGVRPGGLHAYDGHLRQRDPAERRARCDEAFAPVEELRRRLLAAGHVVPALVAGGTPTFPIHVRRSGVEASPGTCVLWDAGYGGTLPDLDFVPAALVLTRVVSRLATGRACLDLGHKAIASENPHPRVQILGLPGATALGHSEEHLVIDTGGPDLRVGDVLYGIPWHVCPTVALHDEAVIASGGRAVDRWPIAARGRRITI
jgi:D-serine deaminase-like pyridoxal phosphate-dependent protein